MNSVKSDIELYYKKLVKGGVLGGHDFNIAFPYLCKAVIEFAEQYNLIIYESRRDWWFIKK